MATTTSMLFTFVLKELTAQNYLDLRKFILVRDEVTFFTIHSKIKRNLYLHFRSFPIIYFSRFKKNRLFEVCNGFWVASTIRCPKFRPRS